MHYSEELEVEGLKEAKPSLELENESRKGLGYTIYRLMKSSSNFENADNNVSPSPCETFSFQ